MKSGRLLSMLLILQSKGRSCARDLAAALEVSERTIYRDVDALSAAGIPVYTERGSGGGLYLSEGYRKTLTQFGEDEIRALFFSGSNPLMDLGVGSEHALAMQKLTGAMTDAQRRAVEKSRDRIYVDQRRWHQSEQPKELLAELRRAVWDDRCVRMTYSDRNRAVTTRVIHPLGLAAKAGIWYVVARSDAALRTFRAERIKSVEPLDEHFVRPADFNLDSYWRNWTSELENNAPRFCVTLSVAPADCDQICSFWQGEVLERGATPESAVTLRIAFPARDSALHQLVAWGAKVNLVDPPDLREEIVRSAQALLVHYGTQRSHGVKVGIR